MLDHTIAKFSAFVEKVAFRDYQFAVRDWLCASIDGLQLEDERGFRQAKVSDIEGGTIGKLTFSDGALEVSMWMPRDYSPEPKICSDMLLFSRGSRSSILDFVFRFCSETKPAQGCLSMPNDEDSLPRHFGLDHNGFLLVEDALNKAIIGEDKDAYWLGERLADRFVSSLSPGVLTMIAETCDNSMSLSRVGLLVAAESHADVDSLKTELGDLLFSSGKRKDLMISMPHFVYLGERLPVDEAKNWSPSLLLGRKSKG